MKKFLILKPSSLGDVIHAFPVVSSISAHVPGAVIDWVVRPEYAELVQAHPAVRRVFLFERNRWSKWSRSLRTASEAAGLVRSLRRERYDVALDLQGLFRSALIAFLSGAAERTGFANAREGAPFFYHRRVAVPEEAIHAVDRYGLVLKAIGIDGPLAGPGLRISPEVEALVGELLAAEGAKSGVPLVVLNPNARWETKKWLSERFAELADRLVQSLGAVVVLVGSPGDASGVAGIVSQVKGRVVNLAGRTSLLQLAALLKRADLMVTCDSGPMHLAAAMGTKVVALFGPTDPVRTGPYGEDHRVIRSGIPCSSCLKRDCPEGTTACMAEIQVDDVFRAAVSMLGDGMEGEKKSKATYHGKH
ncbi:MAG: lipopolysaccharide heptosyltransferase I [Deltaproteobacteria bacterium]|nr:lipopolysaccharide heptosyltransferase I [Deltaproteobacteria bacterium]